MADLNALIAQGVQFQAPPNPFAQYAQMQQLQQGEQANQLNQMKMQEMQRGLQEQNALRSVVSQSGFDPMNPTHQATAFAAAPTLAPGYLEKALTTRETVAKIGKTGAEEGKINFETQLAKANKAVTDITSLSSPQEAAASIDAHLAAGDITADKAAMLKNALSSAPSFGDWQKKMVMGILDAKEQLTMTAPKPTEMRLGNTVKTIDMNPNSPTYKQEVLPPQAIGMSEYEKAHIPILQQGANAASTSAGAAAANAANAAARLNFDKAKIQWEKDNPAFNIEKVDQADGTTQFVAIDKITRQATPINMAPPAAPAGAGRGSVGVTDMRTGAGVPLISAAKPKEAPAKFHDIDIQLAGLAGSLKQFKDEVNNMKVTGASYLPKGEDTARMQAKYTALLMGLKDLYTLGALTGPDMSIIESQITNPASWTGKFTSDAGIRQQTKVIEDMLNRSAANVENSYGRKPNATSSAMQQLKPSASTSADGEWKVVK